jgi:uncharacterized protein YdhG (YjbR/CyaY superfamily)
MAAPTTVEEYLATLPDEVRPVLEGVRRAILDAVPGATEGIRYQMPVVSLGDTYVVHYSAWKRHIGLYPVPPQEAGLEHELAPLRSGKDSVQLPLSAPMPLDLVGRLARALAAQRSDPGR